MFLQNSQRKIEEEFLKLTEKFGADREPLKTICEKLDGCGRDLGLAMKYLYVTAPYSCLLYTSGSCRDPETEESGIRTCFSGSWNQQIQHYYEGSDPEHSQRYRNQRDVHNPKRYLCLLYTSRCV